MKPRHKRIAIAAGIVCAVGAAAALVLDAFQSNLVFFYSPSQVAAKEAPTARTFRLGGMVEKGTLKREGKLATFVVTDTAKSIPVRYEGILPDLFKEGKGVVARASCRVTSSSPAKCSPSTTRTTCRPRPPTRSSAPSRATPSSPNR